MGRGQHQCGPDDDLIFGEMPATPTHTPLLAAWAPTLSMVRRQRRIYGDSDGGRRKADLIYGDGGLNDSLATTTRSMATATVGHHLAADTIFGEGVMTRSTAMPSGAEGSADSLKSVASATTSTTPRRDDYAEGNMGNGHPLGGDGAEGAADTLVGGNGRDILVGDGGVLNHKNKAGGADQLNSPDDVIDDPVR